MSNSEKEGCQIDWIKLMSRILLLAGLDISIHYQFSIDQQLDGIDLEKNNYTLDATVVLDDPTPYNYHDTAQQLLYSAMARFIFVLTCWQLSRKKAIPKAVQPVAGYVIGGFVYLFFIHALYRLLLHSEQYGLALSLSYTFLTVFNVIANIATCFMARHVVLASGAIEEPKSDIDENNEDGEKDIENGERTIPMITMLGKLALWYRHEFKWIILGYLCLAVKMSMYALEPYWTSKMIEAATSSTDNIMEELPYVLFKLATTLMMLHVMHSTRESIRDITSNKVALQARGKLFRNIMEQDIAFFDTTKSGEILRRLGIVTNEMSHVWIRIDDTMNNVCEMLAMLVMMLGMSWRMTLVQIMCIYLVSVPDHFLRKYHEDQWKKEEKIQRNLSSMASEAVKCIRTVKTFANEDLEASKYDEKLNDLYVTGKSDIVKKPIMQTFERVCFIASQTIILLYGGHLMSMGLLSSGDFVGFLLYMHHLWYRFRHLAEWQSKEFCRSMLKMETFFEYIERKPEVPPAGEEKPDDLQGKLEFKDVEFSYASRPKNKVLKGVSFTVNAGEVVALVGPSGGGKSSCVNLIQRFYQPTSGEILLDGKPIDSYENDYFHEQLAIVSQEPALFGRSIEENIKYGKGHATREELIKAAEDSNAHDFITKLKDSYKTDVGESGSQLSGGQRQRIAIARGLIRNPKIMLLDEATSALDAESESIVQEALEKGMQGRTVVIIAHRLSTVRHADKIVVIKEGTVAEQGTHEELLAKKGVYENLVRKQMRVKVNEL